MNFMPEVASAMKVLANPASQQPGPPLGLHAVGGGGGGCGFIPAAWAPSRGAWGGGGGGSVWLPLQLVWL